MGQQIVSKANIDMYKSWENLHIGLHLIFVALDTISGFKWVSGEIDTKYGSRVIYFWFYNKVWAH